MAEADNVSVNLCPQNVFRNKMAIEDRIGFKFRTISAISILIVSLLGGFVWGLRNGPTPAEALIAAPASLPGWKAKLIVYPSELTIHPIGGSSEINGRPTEAAAFESGSDVKTVAAKIVADWQAKGFQASGIAFSDRGAAFGISNDLRIRTSLGIWRNLQTGRTEGILSAAEIVDGKNPTSNEFISGVTYPKNSRLGATFKTVEQGEVSWSSSLTTSGNLRAVSEWYIRELSGDGWQNAENSSTSFLQFKRKNEELTLLLAAVPKTKGSEEVFISVIKKSVGRER